MQVSQARDRVSLWWGAVLIAAFLGGCVTTLVVQWATRGEASPAVYDEAAKVTACQTNAISLTKPEKLDIRVLQQISELCYEEVRRNDILGDFQIRRSNYMEQRYAGKILLWMVVAITISGVILAGIQLFVAYQLASIGRGEFAQGGEATLERSKVSVRSSVTGLLILTVSFAFFMVFVIWIYTIKEMTITPEEGGMQADTTIPLLRPGGLGAPPKPSGGPSNPAAVP
jgi:hypothetical protein